MSKAQLEKRLDKLKELHMVMRQGRLELYLSPFSISIEDVESRNSYGRRVLIKQVKHMNKLH